ncbi:unnamed protein product, partial [Mesorhabditis belari]|uniref:Protein N-terminal glutamine amidohydrolase n=1 Tax=Mesorhabditis belari TaxID=2138241 RepID=A0AAF3J5V6_9BILA
MEHSSIESYDYTKCYCEENIYKLCARIPKEKLGHFHVAFLSNENRAFPIFDQKTAKQRPYVIWDYHVILIEKRDKPNTSQVFDFDTTRPFPTSFADYCKYSFPYEYVFPPEYTRYFRIIDAEAYLKQFSSDRRHMKKEDGSWMSEPPKWEPIYRGEAGHNLDDFISMSPDSSTASYSQVVDETDFVQYFSDNKRTIMRMARFEQFSSRKSKVQNQQKFFSEDD